MDDKENHLNFRLQEPILLCEPPIYSLSIITINPVIECENKVTTTGIEPVPSAEICELQRSGGALPTELDGLDVRTEPIFSRIPLGFKLRQKIGRIFSGPTMRHDPNGHQGAMAKR